MNIFAKAQAGANLTPGERALLKAIKGFALAGATAALLALFQLLSTGTVNVARDWPFVAGAGLIAFLLAWEKYATAQGDAPLAAALHVAAADVGQWAGTGVNDVGNKPATPVLAAPVNLAAVGPMTVTTPASYTPPLFPQQPVKTNVYVDGVLQPAPFTPTSDVSPGT